MTRALRAAVLVVGSLLVHGGSARAWVSASGGTGLFDVRSAEVSGRGSVDVQASGVTYRGDESNGLGRNQVDIVDGRLQVNVGLPGITEVWAAFGTAYYSQVGGAYRATSIRDGRVGGKIRLGNGRFVPGLAVETSIPWGVRARGFSTGSFDPAVTALFTLHLPESNTLTGANLHANVGFRHQGDARGRGFEGWPLYYLEPVHPAFHRDQLDLRLALELTGRRTTLFAELLLDQLLSDGFSFRESPMFLTPGVRWSFTDSWSLLATSKITLSSDDPATTRYKSPDDLYPNWQFGFALAWSRRGSGADSDGDGVPDFRDECPQTPEDRDGWQDADGCPDRDDDGDGIPDEFDGAPRAAEDLDGWKDTDGIPDPDNDGDGILDVDDLCPDHAEDFDGVADADGCPETDADQDGILDEDDTCPEQAETVDGVEDEDGCPERVSLDPEWLQRVTWEGAAVAPKPTSYYDLNQLAERMQRDAGMSVEIRVLAADPARPGKMDLATLRAEYLKAFLVATGVDPARVLAKGMKAPLQTGGDGPLPRVEVVANESIPASGDSPPPSGR